jgi:hypothetical protein
MARAVSAIVNAADREHLAAVVEDGNRPLKHVRRAFCFVAGSLHGDSA